MASSEERMKILKMIEEGKLSAEEGTKLLTALSDKRMPTPPRPPGMPGGPRWLPVPPTAGGVGCSSFYKVQARNALDLM